MPRMAKHLIRREPLVEQPHPHKSPRHHADSERITPYARAIHAHEPGQRP
jgi:hypothetical protein